jgi:hypothetical protein
MRLESTTCGGTKKAAQTRIEARSASGWSSRPTAVHAVTVNSGALNAATAVSILSAASGRSYELVGRLAGGETGAYELRGPSETRLVVKWDTDPSSAALRREAVVLSDRLRMEAGWPVPGQEVVLADECLFVLQEFMPGSPVRQISHNLVDQVVDLHARRVGLARPDDPSHWPTALIRTLTEGGDGYCVHESLTRYNQRTRDLVARIEEFGRNIYPGDLVGHDIVHWDLHPGNILAVDGKLGAIIDTDFAVVGDAGFDLVAFALGSLTMPCEDGVQRRLFDAAFDGLTNLERMAYLGHLFLRVIDWPIRRGRPEEVEFWLAHSDRMLGI